MEKFIEQLTNINGTINTFVWVTIGLVLLLGTDVLMTVCTKFFQITHLGHWWKETIGSLFKKNSSSTKKTDKKTISQFQALCTALAVWRRPLLSAAPAQFSGCGSPHFSA